MVSLVVVAVVVVVVVVVVVLGGVVSDVGRLQHARLKWADNVNSE